MKMYYPKDANGNRIGFKTPESQVYDKTGKSLTEKLKKDFQKRWYEHGGNDDIVVLNLKDYITNKIENEDILNGEFSYFNTTFTDGCPGVGNYGIVRYHKHVDLFVTVWMSSESTSVREYVARFVIGEDDWREGWSKSLNAKYDVKNSVGTTEEGFVLDARVGKTLNDKIESIYKALKKTSKRR